MNDDLEKAGKATQFSDGNAVQKNGKPWSIRNSVRYLASQSIDPTNEKPFEDSLKDIKKPTGAQLIAARALDAALKGSERMVEYATDNVDGKLVQTNINADLEAIKNMTDDQLDDFIAGADAKARAGTGADGEKAPSGDEGAGDQGAG